jgi:hypothetical protein
MQTVVRLLQKTNLSSSLIEVPLSTDHTNWSKYSLMPILVLCVPPLSGVEGRYRRFGGTCCLHLQAVCSSETLVLPWGSFFGSCHGRVTMGQGVLSNTEIILKCSWTFYCLLCTNKSKTRYIHVNTNTSTLWIISKSFSVIFLLIGLWDRDLA